MVISKLSRIALFATLLASASVFAASTSPVPSPPIVGAKSFLLIDGSTGAELASLKPEMRRVVVDGFAALQQATFASPKRKSIKAYQDFVKGGGQLYVPTPEQKADFKKAAEPVFDWFQNNIKGGKEVYGALVKAVAEAEAKINKSTEADLQ